MLIPIEGWSCKELFDPDAPDGTGFTATRLEFVTVQSPTSIKKNPGETSLY